jgi:taurine--2-oxoglutarate transaminase
MAEQYPFFFTWSAQRGAAAIEITGGEGAEFTTSDGSRWLDLGSLSYQASLGHGHPRVTDALVAQARTLALAMPSASFPAKTELATRLLALAPAGYDRVFFTLSGAEANENAIKIARLTTGRYKIAARYRSYHGATMGALSLTGDWRRPALEPGLPGVVRFPDCNCEHCPLGHESASCDCQCAAQLDDILAQETGVAAVLLEVIPGANGVLLPAHDYLARVREICDRHGTLLIADEVLTGFGRSGRGFAFEHYGVAPDMITVAKALTGGYAPLGAVLVHSRVAAHFDDNVLVAGSTNYAHPLSCAAGLAALEVYEEDGLFARSAALEPSLRRGLERLRARFPANIHSVRGRGLLFAAEVDLSAEQWQLLRNAVAAAKLYLHVDQRRGTVIFAPPLIIEDSVLESGIERFATAFAEAVEEGNRQ